MRTSIEEQMRLARRGEHTRLVCCLSSSWLFLGVYQYLPGYCVLVADPIVESLNALSLRERSRFLLEMSAVGDALLEVTGAARINYSVLGNGDPTLHAHIQPRYAHEDEPKCSGPVELYGDALLSAPFEIERHRPLLEALRGNLEARGLRRGLSRDPGDYAWVMPDITVRHTEPSDFEALYKIFACPGVVRGTMQLPYPSAESWRKRLESPPPDFYSLVAIAEGEIVGNIGLSTSPRPRRRHVGSLGMAVHDDWRGRGVGTALLSAALELADGWLELTRTELTVYTDNTPALRLYEKFGFVREGTHRQYAFRDGVYIDAYAMARLRNTR